MSPDARTVHIRVWNASTTCKSKDFNEKTVASAGLTLCATNSLLFLEILQGSPPRISNPDEFLSQAVWGSAFLSIV
jgi:hypothetical protein